MDADFSLLPAVTLVTTQRPHGTLRGRLALLLQEGVESPCSGRGERRCQTDAYIRRDTHKQTRCQKSYKYHTCGAALPSRNDKTHASGHVAAHQHSTESKKSTLIDFQLKIHLCFLHSKFIYSSAFKAEPKQ